MIKQVSLLPADLEVSLNKKEMIRKMKKERKKNNLMAMLKTVKRRKNDDLVAEATTELVQIDQEVSAHSPEFEEPIPSQMVEIESRPRPKLELPVPKRFNFEKLGTWEKELEHMFPVPEVESLHFSPEQHSVSNFKDRSNPFLLVQAQEPQLLKDLLEEIDNKLIGNMDIDEPLIDGLYKEDEDFSLIQDSDGLLNMDDNLLLASDLLASVEKEEKSKHRDP